jgi:hypothetical protein
MAASAAEYKKLIEREMARKAGPQTSRDDAVRRANIAAGFGNSTAERFLGGPFKLAPESGGGGGGKSRGGGGGKAAGGPQTSSVTPSSPARDPSLMWESPPPAASPARDPSLMWESPPPNPSPARDPSLMWQGGTAQNGVDPFLHIGPGLHPQDAGVPVPTPRPSPFTNDLVRPGFSDFVRGQHVFPNFHPASIFQASPPDPNEPWWRAMLRG